MSMSPAYHLLGKAMNGEALNENQVRQIVGVIRKDERLKERERIIQLLEEHTYYGQDGWLELSDKALTRADLIDLIKGEQK